MRFRCQHNEGIFYSPICTMKKVDLKTVSKTKNLKKYTFFQKSG